MGQAVATDMPTVTGTVTGYSVSPTLPAGLSLSTSTGAISGTPTAASAQTSYTITATNVSGSATAAVQITVNPAAPTNLVYPQTTITASVGQAIASDTPTVTGTVTSYSVNPALPAGLNLSTSTGVLSGSPTAVSAQASYTVTATNVSGSATATVKITVNPAAPTNLVYPQTAITTTVGQADCDGHTHRDGHGHKLLGEPSSTCGFELEHVDGSDLGHADWGERARYVHGYGDERNRFDDGSRADHSDILRRRRTWFIRRARLRRWSLRRLRPIRRR